MGTKISQLPAASSATPATDVSVVNVAGTTSKMTLLDIMRSPQISKSADYTVVLSDEAKHILHPSDDTTARTFTIPANSSVPFPIGTAITFVNQNGAGVLIIAITTDTMRLAGEGATGSRKLAANGIATALKITATEWIISGTGLTGAKAIFGYGWTGGVVSMTNLVSNLGVVAADTTGVGTARSGLAAAGYGGDKAIFGYGYTSAVVSMTNLVSNLGVVAADTTGVGTARSGLAAAGYGA